MARTTAVEFQRKFGQYQDVALREPVEITKHGRSHLVLLSAEEYHRLVSRVRRAYAAEEVPDDLVRAVAESEMAPEHAELDKLLNER